MTFTTLGLLKGRCWLEVGTRLSQAELENLVKIIKFNSK